MLWIESRMASTTAGSCDVVMIRFLGVEQSMQDEKTDLELLLGDPRY
jgi:hypothetical protein